MTAPTLRARIFPEHEPLRRAAPWIVGVVAVLVFANALANGFVLDDKEIIQRNPIVHSLRGLLLAWVTPYWPPPLDIGQYRPLVTVSYVIDWAISGGDPRWFHAVNIVWHLAATLAVWRLARDLLSPAGAMACGLLFAVHSVHVEAIANTVGRAEAMATFFVVAGLLVHRRAGPENEAKGTLDQASLVRWASPVLFALGIASKENAIVFVALAFGLDVLLSFRPVEELRARRWLYAAYGAVVLVYVVALALIFRGRTLVLVAPVFWGVEGLPRVLTALSVVPHYVRLLLFPLELSSDYSPRIINLAESITPLVVAGVAILGLAIAAMVASWRRAPLLAYSIFWILAALAPVSNLFFATGIALAERTLYLPSVGLALGAAFLLEHFAQARLRPAIAIMAIAVVALSARTWMRNATWRDSQTWLSTLLTDHPESYKARAYYGQLLVALSKYRDADLEYTRARMLFQRDPYLFQSAGDVATQLREYPRALALMDTSVALHPALATAHVKRADLRFLTGDLVGARESARHVASLRADSATLVGAAIIDGVVTQRMGRSAEAVQLFREHARRFPGAWQLQVGLADALLMMGDTAEARVAARRAVETATAAARASASDSAAVPAAAAVSQRAGGSD